MNSSIFVCNLSQDKQNKIKKLVTKHLKVEGLEVDKIKEIVGNVMSDRLVNIEEIVDISQFL